MQAEMIEDGIEINGYSVRAVFEGFGSFTMLASTYLLAEGIGRPGPKGEAIIDSEAWYPLKSWIRAFDRISQEVGDHLLHLIGRSILRTAKMPPWVNDIHSASQAGNIAYHMNHRKNGVPMFSPETGEILEGIGNYGYQKGEGRKIISVCDTPFPCDFDMGILEATVTRFEPTALLGHDPTQPCRKKGGLDCTYIITW